MSDIESRWAEMSEGIISPLADAAEDVGSTGDIYFGLPLIDHHLRGLRPESLYLLTGFAHNGKTQLFITLVVNNPDKKIILFTPDESRSMVLLKLLAAASNESREEIEHWGARRIRDATNYYIPNIVVIDTSLDAGQIHASMGQAQALLGGPADLACYDYMSQLPDWPDNIPQKARVFKELAKETKIPWLVIHQANRTEARDAHMSMEKMSFGGEQEATAVIACRRAIFTDKKMTSGQKLWEETHPTIHVAIVKNKWGSMTDPMGIKHYIRTPGGLVVPERDES